jgi:hypothetical protein
MYDLRDIAQLTSAGLHLTAVHGGPKPAATYKPATSALKPVAKLEKKPAEGKGPTLYQIEKSSVVDRPCFNPLPGATARAVIDPTLLCGSNEPADAAEQQVNTLTRTGGFVAPDLAAGLEKVRADYVAALEQKNQTAIAAQMRALPAIPPDATLQVRLYMRSPEAILHFLGSVVARELYPGSSAPRVIRVKIGEPYLPYPAARCPATNDPNAPGDVSPGFRCDNLFVLLQGQSTDSALSVDYDGRSYSVPASDRVAGRTMRMLDLIKQIMALHTSAKDLPASNVLNIIGGAAP